LPHDVCSRLISSHEIGKLLDEEMTGQERKELEEAEAICRRFLMWNLESEECNVRQKLAEVLGRDQAAET
jgi:DNA mismatch repair protein MSH5